VTAVRRVLVGVSGSLGNLQALRFASEEARQRDVPLVPVTAWTPPGGDMADRRYPSTALREIWRDAAWKRLWNAFDEALGGVPADVRIEPRVVRGDAGAVLVDLAAGESDLLVIGTGQRGWLHRVLNKSAGRYCLAHAHCPVIAVPPSALTDSISTGLHRPWPMRRHLTVPDLAR
jgi:nucleotide-binding universal stress UspA family protein